MNDTSRVVWMRRSMAALGVLLFLATWKLWTPPSVFPQIPVSRWLVDIPGWVDWIALSGALAGLVAMIVLIERRRVIGAEIAFLVSVLVLVALNQHRLQPWVYLMAIYCGYLLTRNDEAAVKWMRWTVASIYIFSAISKLDYQFVFTVGQQMVAVVAQFTGIDFAGAAEETKLAAVCLLPLGELVLGVMVLVPKCRRLTGGLTILLHLSLLVVLGPLGLNHAPGVLIWNAFFIAQAWILLAAPDQSLAPNQSAVEKYPLARESSPQRWLGVAIGAFVITFPVTASISPTIELPIKADHWLAWEVYAPRSSRAARSPTRRAVGDEVAPSINQLSLKTLGVPVYPQARFQVACLIALNQSRQSGRDGENRQNPRSGGNGLRAAPVLVLGTSNRWTGRRQTIRLDSQMAYDVFCREHWFNMQARQRSLAVAGQ